MKSTEIKQVWVKEHDCPFTILSFYTLPLAIDFLQAKANTLEHHINVHNKILTTVINFFFRSGRESAKGPTHSAAALQCKLPQQQHPHNRQPRTSPQLPKGRGESACRQRGSNSSAISNNIIRDRQLRQLQQPHRQPQRKAQHKQLQRPQAVLSPRLEVLLLRVCTTTGRVSTLVHSQVRRTSLNSF